MNTRSFESGKVEEQNNNKENERESINYKIIATSFQTIRAAGNMSSNN